jgi:HlyD family secretion protein
MNRTRTCLPLLVLLLAACGPDEDRPRVVTGLVDATEIDVASKVPGRVKQLFVREGDPVTAGQALVAISGEDIEAKVGQVEAAIGAARARLALARSGARIEDKEQAKRAVDAARHQLELAEKIHERTTALVPVGGVPPAKVDEVEAQLALARDNLEIARARSEAVEKGARREEVEALEALVRQAEGSLAEVSSYRDELTQDAPTAGEVAKVVLHEGELAATGYPILTLVRIDDPWFSFAVREDLLAGLAVGQAIQVEVPALGRTVEATVFQLAPLGDFATWKATAEKDGFDLKSFEVKARPTNKVEGLRPGMTARFTPGR